jgi:hypothetical protein
MVGEKPYRGLMHSGWLTPLWTVGAKRFEFTEVKQLGTDIRVRARLPERWRELMQSIHLIESNTGKVQ